MHLYESLQDLEQMVRRAGHEVWRDGHEGQRVRGVWAVPAALVSQAEGVTSTRGRSHVAFSETAVPSISDGALCVRLSVPAPEQPVLESDTAVFLLLEQPARLSRGVILPQDFMTGSICAVQLLNSS